MIFPSTAAIGDTFTINKTTYVWNGFGWECASPLFIKNNQDVGITTPLDGQLLTYNDANLRWENKHPRIAWKNKIVNGDMRIDQRNNGVSISEGAGISAYPVDRFFVNTTIAGNQFTVGRDSQGGSILSGFQNYLGINNNTAIASITASTASVLEQSIEGVDIQDLKWGTAQAESITLSFWHFSYLAGNYAVSIRNRGTTRSYVTEFAGGIGGWQRIEITIPGDTGGSWNTGEGVIGLIVNWNLGSGSNFRTSTLNAWQNGSFVSGSASIQTISTLNAWYLITGVQLEIGNNGTPFEYMHYGDMLNKCQRYFVSFDSRVYGVGAPFGFGLVTGSGTLALVQVNFPVEMCRRPSFQWAGAVKAYDGNGEFTITNATLGASTSRKTCFIEVNLPFAFGTFRPVFLFATDNTGRVFFNAENG